MQFLYPKPNSVVFNDICSLNASFMQRSIQGFDINEFFFILLPLALKS